MKRTLLPRVQGTVDYESLKVCLDEVRRRRNTEPEVTLAALLVQRNLAAAEVVNNALARLAEDPTLLEKTLSETAPPSGQPTLPGQLGPYIFVRELARGATRSSAA